MYNHYFFRLPGNILSNEGGKLKICVTLPAFVEHPKTKEITSAATDFEIELDSKKNSDLPLQNVDGGGNPLILNDMVELPSLTEASILANLMARHIDGKPYTKIGDIVIALNPFEWIADMYSEDQRQYYAEMLVWNYNDRREKLNPHVYETSSGAYRGLAVDGKNQSILVSGESGAGKTETVKDLSKNLAQFCVVSKI